MIFASILVGFTGEAKRASLHMVPNLSRDLMKQENIIMHLSIIQITICVFVFLVIVSAVVWFVRRSRTR